MEGKKLSVADARQDRRKFSAAVGGEQRRDSYSVDEFLKKKLSIDERPPMKNPFDRTSIKPRPSLPTPYVQDVWERDWLGSIVLILSFLAAVIRVVAVVTIVLTAVGLNLFTTSGWATAFAIGALCICSILWFHAKFAFKTLSVPGYLQRDSVMKDVGLPTLASFIVHTVIIAFLPYILPHALLDLNEEPSWWLIPSIAIPFIVLDVIVFVLVWSAQTRPDAFVARFMHPFTHGKSLGSLTVTEEP